MSRSNFSRLNSRSCGVLAPAFLCALVSGSIHAAGLDRGAVAIGRYFAYREWITAEVNRAANERAYFQPDRRPIKVRVTLQSGSMLLDLDRSLGDMVGSEALTEFHHYVVSAVNKLPDGSNGPSSAELRIGGYGLNEWTTFPAPGSRPGDYHGPDAAKPLADMLPGELRQMEARLATLAAAAVNASGFVCPCSARVAVSIEAKSGRVALDVAGDSVTVEDDVGQEHLAMALRYGVYPVLSKVPDVKQVDWLKDGERIY